jgi:hypothetical protein
MDEQNVVSEEERGTQPGLQLIVGGMSLEPVRDEQEVDELAFVERFRAQVHFQLSDPTGAHALVDEMPYFVQILAYNLATGRTEVLATEYQCMQAGKSDYTLPAEFATPKVGRYKLLGTVLLPDGDAAGVALGPGLHIVPE